MDFSNNRGERSSMRAPPSSFDNSFPPPSHSFRRSATFSQPMQHNAQLQSQLSDPTERTHARASSDWDHTLSQGDVSSRSMTQNTSQNNQVAPRSLQEKIQELRTLQQRALQQETEMHLIQQKKKQSEEEVAQLINGYQAMHPQSEPTTPPEYHDSGFPTALSRPNRFSGSMIGTVPAIGSNRPSRAGSQLTSPSSGLISSQFKTPGSSAANRLTWKSVPGSRRNSDEEDEPEPLEDQWADHRAAATRNRNSMPVTGLNRSIDRSSMSNDRGFKPHVNTANYLFGDDEGDGSKDQSLASPQDIHSYLQMNATDDKFPILVRQGDQSGKLSASSAALDLALSSSSSSQQGVQDVWSTFGRRRSSPQKSLPHNILSSSTLHRVSNGTLGETSAFVPRTDSKSARVSMGSEYGSYFDKDQSNAAALASLTGAQGAPPRLQSSYSTNDIPTVKNQRRSLIGFGSTANVHAEQHLHNHNASMGRVPPNGSSARQSREFNGADTARLSRDIQAASVMGSGASNLKANAAPFGPSVTSPISIDPESSFGATKLDQYQGYPYHQGVAEQVGQPPDFQAMAQQQPGLQQYPPYSNQQQANAGQMAPAYYNPRQYNGQAFQGLPPHMNSANQYGMPFVGGLPPNGAMSRNQAVQYQTAPRGRESHLAAQRRREELEAQRFATVPIEQCRGQIYSMARDQHGCRYLQRKLEERNPLYVRMIFEEVYQGVVELMTDPFGNYLCQKLLEHANDDQRTALIGTAAPQLVRIAVNQHGTRALQRMIDFLTTPEQVAIVIIALRDDVVSLIKDLNGNHVIQKCLNKMSSEDAQFIFDNVSKYIVTIGTHRHGCCVIQRCLDHSTLAQKKQIVETVTLNSFSLNEDPFGNYVTQYILDLRDAEFVEPMIERFRHHIVVFSKHKFSSNVIEKCIRVGQDSTKRWIIEEMMIPGELENMARDQYANYVVQTAMDRVEEDLEKVLFGRIRAILPSIRTTPHGRRILSKLQSHDQRIAEGRPHPYRRKANTLVHGDNVLALRQSGSNSTSNPSSKPPSRPTSQSVSRTTSRPVSSHGFGGMDAGLQFQATSGPLDNDATGYNLAGSSVTDLGNFSRLSLGGSIMGNPMPSLPMKNAVMAFDGSGSMDQRYGGHWNGNEQPHHSLAGKDNNSPNPQPPAPSNDPAPGPAHINSGADTKSQQAAHYTFI
ncbi:MAG: hypothetical protein M1814_005940 [Vezdaea aestivalis]|nr:MAG: hypothetical protein M1814_005940 [Vezdaea aestivalis]